MSDCLPRGSWSQTHAPTLAAIELLKQRWSIRLVWELEPGPIHVDPLLRRLAQESQTEVTQQLQHLQNLGLVETDTEDSYRLTAVGTQLAQALHPIWQWANDCPTRMR